MKHAASLLAMVAVVLLAGMPRLNAQPIEIGINAGLSVPGAVSVTNTTEAARNDLIVGASLAYPISSIFRIQAGVQYVRRGLRTGFAIAGGPTIPSNSTLVNMNYLELPIDFKLAVGSRFQVYAVAGTNIGTLLKAADEYQANDGHSTAIQTADVSPVNISLLAGGGCSYQVAPHVAIAIDARYSYGLLTQSNHAQEFTSPSSWKARDLEITSGLIFSL
ncbi:MAG: PorT family protein [Bacteroidetes bacterium]|nr:PorT family protein [Bacteroidota bacterium]